MGPAPDERSRPTPPHPAVQSLLPGITTSVTITGNCGSDGSNPYNGKCLLDGAGLGEPRAWGEGGGLGGCAVR